MIQEGVKVRIKYDTGDLIGTVVKDTGDRLVLCEFPNLPPVWLSREGLEVVENETAKVG